MPKFTITGVDARVDGEYDLDPKDIFTGDEAHLIKQISGVRLGELDDAMGAYDYDLVVALAKITLNRHGKDIPTEKLTAAKIGAIKMDKTDAETAAEQENDDLPPASAPSGATETRSDPEPSGTPSSNGSDILPESALPVIGVQH